MTEFGTAVRFKYDRYHVEVSNWLPSVLKNCLRLTDNVPLFIDKFMVPVITKVMVVNHCHVSHADPVNICEQIMVSMPTITIVVASCSLSQDYMEGDTSFERPRIVVQGKWYLRATDDLDAYNNTAIERTKHAHVVMGTVKLLHELFRLFAPYFQVVEFEIRTRQTKDPAVCNVPVNVVELVKQATSPLDDELQDGPPTKNTKLEVGPHACARASTVLTMTQDEAMVLLPTVLGITGCMSVAEVYGDLGAVFEEILFNGYRAHMLHDNWIPSEICFEKVEVVDMTPTGRQPNPGKKAVFTSCEIFEWELYCARVVDHFADKAKTFQELIDVWAIPAEGDLHYALTYQRKVAPSDLVPTYGKLQDINKVAPNAKYLAAMAELNAEPWDGDCAKEIYPPTEHRKS